MDFLFDTSLIPAGGPGSQLKHRDLMPAPAAPRMAGASSKSGGLDNHAAKKPISGPGAARGRPRRGHGRSASIDSCAGTAPSSFVPGSMLAKGAPIMPDRSRTNAQVVGPALSHEVGRSQDRRARGRGHARRHSASLDGITVHSDPRLLRSKLPNQQETHSRARSNPSMAPVRKQTAPAAISADTAIKRPHASGSSLPLPRRKGSTPQHPPSQSSGPPLNSVPSHVTAPTKSHLHLRVPTNRAYPGVSPRSGSYTSTFAITPHTAHPPHSGSGSSPSGSTTTSSDSEAGTDDSSDTSATARPAISPAELLSLPNLDLPRDFSARLMHLIPAQRRPSHCVPQGSMHIPSVLLALGYILEILVFERQALKSPSSSIPSKVPPPLSIRRTLLCPHTQAVLWRLVAQHLASLSTLLLPLLEALQSATYSRQVENAMEGARAYILKIRKVFGEVAGLYAEQYAFVEGLWDKRWLKAAAGEIGRWCQVLGA